MKTRPSFFRGSLALFSVATLLAPLALSACGGHTAGSDVPQSPPDAGGEDAPSQPNQGSADASGGADAGDASSGADAGGPIKKIDLLLMIDNSSSMGDKQEFLRQTVPDLIDGLLNPACVDAAGHIIGHSSGGTCNGGSPLFSAVTDLHVAIVSSSLGGRGSDQCPENATGPNGPLHNDDHGHLIARAGADGHAVHDAPQGFLTFAPGGNATTLASDFQDWIQGVDETGCGFEAQLESWYRFLIQPDPFQSLDRPATSPRTTLTGIDETILQQRHDFLRPDSLVAIVALTDENDSTVDPMALGGQGWAFENSTFPGSRTGSAARGTSACDTHPDDPSCTSCGFCQNGLPAAICSDPACQQNSGYLDQAGDPLNVRFFHMKQRFGVDPQFPVQRYVDGLTSAMVPNREGEHPNGSPGYVGTPTCRNPLFAGALPAHGTDELCNLPPGPRTSDQVLFAIIGGVSPQLLHNDPSDPSSSRLSAADWTRILGADPLHYDFTGADPHMLESLQPRAGLPGVTASDTADPVHGREWDTGGEDLQYACTFPLIAPRDCNAHPSSCDCAATRVTNPPLCAGAAPSSTQVRGKGYPSIRELAVARALGDRGIVGSICPTSIDPQAATYGYRPAVQAIIGRAGAVIRARALH